MRERGREEEREKGREKRKVILRIKKQGGEFVQLQKT